MKEHSAGCETGEGSETVACCEWKMEEVFEPVEWFEGAGKLVGPEPEQRPVVDGVSEDVGCWAWCVGRGCSLVWKEQRGHFVDWLGPARQTGDPVTTVVAVAVNEVGSVGTEIGVSAFGALLGVVGRLGCGVGRVHRVPVGVSVKKRRLHGG